MEEWHKNKKLQSRLEKLEEALDRHLQQHFNGDVGASVPSSPSDPSDARLRSVGETPDQPSAASSGSSRTPPVVSYNPAAKVFFKGFEDNPRQGDTRWTLEVYDGIMWQEYKVAPIPEVKP